MNKNERKKALKIFPLRGSASDIEEAVLNETASCRAKSAGVENLDLIGGCYVGNISLLTRPWSRIGVFASRSDDPAVGILREQWAMKMGRTRRCVVGTFHSPAECEILYFVLRFGGYAVWFMGCSLPEKLPEFCDAAIRKGRLLIVSCFNREHHSYASARYCAHLTDMYSSRLAVWSMKAGGMVHSIYNRAKPAGKMVEVF